MASSSEPFAGAESGSPGRALEAGKRGSPGRAVQAGIRGKRLMYFNLTFMNLYFRTDPYSISKLSHFYAIHTADNTDGKVTGGG